MMKVGLVGQEVLVVQFFTLVLEEQEEWVVLPVL